MLKVIFMRISFDQVAHIYDRTRGLPPKVMGKLVRALVKEIGKNKAVLDSGVGTGRFAKPLQENGIEVVGIDISRRMMQKAKEKGVENLLRSDVCFLPFRDSCFDATLSVHLLHLISDWQTALGEICRVTKGNLFSVVTKPFRSPVSQAYEELTRKRGYDIRHIGLGERELSKIVEPTRSILAAHMVSNADEHLAFFKQRAYSRQWRVPENVNKCVVNELVKRFAGLKYQLEIWILIWNMDDLKTCIK
jgi:ubiquinone/menaquinone biosynthesis C-methylase UbiE